MAALGHAPEPDTVERLLALGELLTSGEIELRHAERAAAAARWRSARRDSSLHDDVPFVRELARLARHPAYLKTPLSPDDPSGEHYGFSDAGELCVVVLPAEDPVGISSVTTIHPQRDGELWVEEWRDGASGDRRTRADLILREDGRVNATVSIEPGGTQGTIREFVWSGDRPVAQRSWDAELGDEPEFAAPTEVHADYDRRGLVALRRIEANGDDDVIWSERRTGDSHEKAIKAWRVALERAVPELVGGAAGRGPVEGVALQYDLAEPYLATIVALRQQTKEPSIEVAESDVTVRWNPAEALARGAASAIEPSRDPELRVLRARIRATRTDTEDAAEAERAVLRTVAKRLNTRRGAWDALGETKPPLIWAVDEQLVELEEDLRAAGIRVQLRR